MNSKNFFITLFRKAWNHIHPTPPPESSIGVFRPVGGIVRVKKNILSLIGGGILILFALLASGMVIVNKLDLPFDFFNIGSRVAHFIERNKTAEKTEAERLLEESLKREEARRAQVLHEEGMDSGAGTNTPTITSEEMRMIEKKRVQDVGQEEKRSSREEAPQPAVSTEERTKLEEERRRMVLEEENAPTQNPTMTAEERAKTQGEAYAPPDPTIFPENNNAQPQDPTITPQG